MTSKGQMTVPKEIRDLLGLKPGDKVEFAPEGDDKVVMRRAKVRSITDLFGILPAGILPETNEELDEMIGDAVVERYLRSR
jgi:AbrB family looped-hinge helix DNA binding protein